METDGHPGSRRRRSRADGGDRPGTTARARSASARDEAEALQLASARRNAFAALARKRPTTILEDVTVPRSELATMVSFVAETAAAFDLQIGTFGHMGDGNLHPTFLADERDADEMHRVHRALDAIVKRTLELGGTITGEHGVGLAKKPWLRQQMGDDQPRADATDQADARSARPAEPRQDLRLISCVSTRSPAHPRLLGPAAVHALRHVPADLSDLRRDRAASATVRAAGSR